MKTPIEQAIEYIEANLNGIGIIINESDLSSKEKIHYKTTAECLKITKIHFENLIPVEKEYAKQVAEAQRQSDVDSVNESLNFNSDAYSITFDMYGKKLVTDNI